MGDNENLADAPIETGAPDQVNNEQRATLADELKNAGLSREEIAETMREVLAELKTPPPVDIEAAEREYFAGLISK